jgi:hypothetical protein
MTSSVNCPEAFGSARKKDPRQEEEEMLVGSRP